MTDREAKRILMNMESLKANSLITVNDCLYEAFNKVINAYFKIYDNIFDGYHYQQIIKENEADDE